MIQLCWWEEASKLGRPPTVDAVSFADLGYLWLVSGAAPSWRLCALLSHSVAKPSSTEEVLRHFWGVVCSSPQLAADDQRRLKKIYSKLSQAGPMNHDSFAHTDTQTHTRTHTHARTHTHTHPHPHTHPPTPTHTHTHTCTDARV